MTSGNAVEIVQALNVPRVIFLPDEYLAKYVGSQDDDGNHRVERPLRSARTLHRLDIQARSAKATRTRRDRASRMPAGRLAEADYVGSTHGMAEYVGEHQHGGARVLLMTECSMADNVAGTIRASSSCARAISVHT